MSVMESAKEAAIQSVGSNQALSFCSVCLDAVVEGEDRSIALLKCGHQFHLDCIGSAFNAKGRMQCPSCREVEQGRWLYANACCIHEIEDLTPEEDAEPYSAAAGLVSHAPWCPYQSTFGYISLEYEELDDFTNGYFNPFQTHQVQVPVVIGGQVHPYLIGMHNISLGRALNNIEGIITRQMNYVDGTSNRIGMRHANNGLQSRPMLLASNGSYGGSSQNYTHNGRFGQPTFRHLSLGFLMGSPQLAQAGSANPASLLRSGNTNARQTRHSDHAFQTTQHRNATRSERTQMSESIHGIGSYSSGYSPNWVYHGNGMRWTAERSQMELFYSYRVPAYQWTWVSNGASSGAMQNQLSSMYPYHVQLSSSSTFARSTPMEGSMEHCLEGPFSGVLH